MSADIDRALISAIQDGLPICARPYARVAERLGVEEDVLIERIRTLLEEGIIKRLGVVVRHHELGFRANAMVVWALPEEAVDEVGARMAAIACVTLCYRRPRRPPAWPYNLFCMVHGRDRGAVLACIERMATELALEDVPRAALFSRRRFKQRGARYTARAPAPRAEAPADAPR